MKYLDMVIKGTDITLPKKTKVFFPIHSFQRDPEYFRNPDVFDPLRFSEERKSEIIPGTYSPFGHGPKNCIGERFANYQTKIGLISIVKNFIIEPSEFTKKTYVIDKASLVLAMKGGVHLKLVPCN
ncbi:hypothetical protein HCN44_010098 [Aphidius gifuensis]|uniref:Cytochrome P450 n=1 Tax=Aphidius gifuensis TaxID=684658 RepID=A0A834XVY4_APHGI|nr:hypothetical protein HCN44_010098 [Aphidius gifuensis]